MTVPSIGQVVHYVSQGSPVREDGSQMYPRQCRAATITEIGAWIDQHSADRETADGQVRTRIVDQLWVDDAAALMVANPTGLFFHERVLAHLAADQERADGGPTGWSCDGVDHPGGTWHWPARTP